MQDHDKNLIIEAVDRLVASNIVVAAATMAASTSPQGGGSIGAYIDAAHVAFKKAHELVRSD